MKKNILIIVTILIVAFLFLLTRINLENRAYETSYQTLDGKKVKELMKEKKQFFVIFISSTCSGSPEFMPTLVSNLVKLRKQKIPFLVIADELYNENLDNNLNNYKSYIILKKTYMC